jgi:hypothetical protein
MISTDHNIWVTAGSGGLVLTRREIAVNPPVCAISRFWPRSLVDCQALISARFARLRRVDGGLTAGWCRGGNGGRLRQIGR